MSRYAMFMERRLNTERRAEHGRHFGQGDQQDRPGRSTGGTALDMRTTEHEVAVEIVVSTNGSANSTRCATSTSRSCAASGIVVCGPSGSGKSTLPAASTASRAGNAAASSSTVWS